MNITSRFLSFTLLGAEWVLWLLIGLSVISFAIMLERLWYFTSHRVNVESLASDLRRLLGKGQLSEAQGRAREAKSFEGDVVSAGVAEFEQGPDAVAEAMSGAKAEHRLKLERNLAVLGTL